MTTHQLTFLGTFQVVRHGVPVSHFHSDKVRALLAYLATESDRPHARARLAALLWPEQRDAAALRNLSQTLVRLREVLGHTDQQPAPLRITSQSIQWIAESTEVDVANFAQLAHSNDPHNLAHATALYQGEFLAGFALPGCEAFEEWLLVTREQFQQQALAALHLLAEQHLAAQHWGDAAAAARRQLELDRWREDAHRQLMRALAGMGDRAAALAAYQRCEQILHDDLSIAPDAATSALAATIRTGTRWDIDTPAPGRSSTSVEVVALRPTLPSPLAPLIGRAGELARIATLLRADRTRLLTIVGVGGAGKTRLALAAAWALRDAFGDGVGWVPLADITPSADSALQADALAIAVGAALGLAFEGRSTPFDQLVRALIERDMVLVLDNCEHLAVTAFVHALLVGVPQLRVLATSRSRLLVAGEQLVRLEGLPLPAPDADDPASYAAVQLFLAQAQRQVPELGSDPLDLAAAVRLCRLLDGLPLGIELAARWVGHYTCDEIAAGIQADLDFPTIHGGDAPERHHSLRAAFDYSWVMLRENERHGLARMAIFRGAFDRAAAQAIAGVRVTTLAALVDASLLRHLGIGRYAIHELVRQFATTRLAELGEAERLAERHATYYLDVLVQQESALYGDAPQTAATVIRNTIDNLRQAWAWAVAHSAWELIAQSLPALRQYVRIDGMFYENASRVAAAAERLGAQLAQGQVAPDQAVLLGRLYGTEAYFLERQEARADAAAVARAAIASAASTGDVVGEAYGFLQLSSATVPYIAALAPQETLTAIGWLEHAITLCRSARAVAPHEQRFATEVEADCLLNLSTIRIDLREYTTACDLAEQALALTQTIGARMQEARALSYSAMALENAGRYAAAYARRLTMLNMARANGSRPQEHTALNNLSCTLIYLGDYRAALEYAQAALRILGDWMRNPYEDADSYHTLSWAACRAGDAALALETARQALAFAQATSRPQNQMLPLLALGDAREALEQYDEAQAAYTAALTLGREHHMPPLIAVALAGIARCQLALGRNNDALAAVDEILRGSDILTLGCLWEPLRIAETCFRVLQTMGDPRATTVLSAAAALLDQQANQLADPEQRRSFCEQVAAHRAILLAVSSPDSHTASNPPASQTTPAITAQAYAWDDAPQIATLYGRHAELAQLERWLTHDRCQLIAVLGIGGVGKTTLAAAAVNAVAAQFDTVIWHSLLNAPPLEELLRTILQRLSNQPIVDLPASLDAQLALMVDSLRQQRCLLVLDNMESILEADQPGQMRPGYVGYAQLIQSMAERRHRSCLLLTSREQPQSRALWSAPLVRSLPLGGLDLAAGQALLTERGLLDTHGDATALIERYSGNPLALKLVAQTVQDLFGDDIAAFLSTAAPIFDDIRAVLDQQFARLSALEREILIWLAIEREPISIQALRDDLIDPGSPRAFLEALRGLQRRSLIEQSAQGCALQNVVTEYLTDVLVDMVGQEVVGDGEDKQTARRGDRETGKPGDTHNEAVISSSPPLRVSVSPCLRISLSGLNRYALLKATAKEYVRASQMRLIMQPLAQQLLARLGRTQLVRQLRQIIVSLQAQIDLVPGYAAGNILNLLLHLGIDVQGYDFARLDIRQAYLQGAHLPNVNFRDAHLAQSVFTYTFGDILAVHFAADGQLRVAGLAQGRICLWQAADGQLLREYQTFGAGASIAAFSPDGRLLASGDTDHQVRLWDVAQGRLLHTLSGHTETPWAVIFSPDGQLAASSGRDGTVQLWDVLAGRLRQTLQAHTTGIHAMAFSNDGQMLASGDVDGIVRLWRVGQAAPLHTFQGHTNEVYALAFDATGTILASASFDRTVRIWQIPAQPGSIQALHTLHIHTQMIRRLIMSPDGFTLATGGHDSFICLWDVRSGQALHTLMGHAYPIHHLAFSADGQTLATVGVDQTICLWDVAKGQRLDTLRAHSNHIYALDFSPDGRFLASGGADSIARLWDMHNPEHVVRTFEGHAHGIYAVAFSPDGTTLASGGRDKLIHLWDTRSGRSIRTLDGHTDDVEDLQFSADGRWLASASSDHTVRLWDVRSGQIIHILYGHTDRVRASAISPDGQLVASASHDRTIRLWDVQSGQTTRILYGHTNGVKWIVFSSDGRLLASSSYDRTMRLWEVASGQEVHIWPAQNSAILSMAFHPAGKLLATGATDNTVRVWAVPNGDLLATLRGHTDLIESVRFSPDGRWLVSGSADETIKLWDSATGACLHTLRAAGPYGGMNIAGVTGISIAQKAALVALGAREGDGERTKNKA